MGVPKRKTSKSKKRMRKGSHKKLIVGGQPCPKCGEMHLPHRVCQHCGTYKGRQVLAVSAD